MSGSVLRGVSVWLIVVVTWVGLWGDLDLANIVVGALVGILVVLVFPPTRGRPRPRVRARSVVALGGAVCTGVARGLVSVTGDTLRRNPGRAARIVRVPLRDASPAFIALATILIGLTPGTLVVAAEGRTVLTVHVLRAVDEQRTRQDLVRVVTLIGRVLGEPTEPGGRS